MAAVLELFDYAFAENGLTAYKHGQLLASQVSGGGGGGRAGRPASATHDA